MDDDELKKHKELQEAEKKAKENQGKQKPDISPQEGTPTVVPKGWIKQTPKLAPGTRVSITLTGTITTTGDIRPDAGSGSVEKV